MSLPDIAGLIGAFLILLAYGASAMGKLDPATAPALLLNLVGAGLVLYSLYFEFNLAAALLESAWVIVAVIGLARLALGRRPSAGG